MNPSVSPPTMQPLAADAPDDVAIPEVPHPAPFLAEMFIDETQLGRVIAHVDNTQYVRWLDRVAELHADSFGYTREHLLERGIMWFVARHEIDYHAEVWPGERLILATWVRDVQRVKSWRDYVIVRPSDDRIVCRASTLWVLVDLDSRRPLRIPDEMVERFQPLERRR